MVSDQDRHDLFVALRRNLGTGPADTVMELLPPTGGSDVARRGDVETLRAEMTANMARMEARIIAANVATVIAMGGLVLAAVKF